MILHSTNGQSPKASLAEAITNGLAPDGGLYMPDYLPRLPQAFFSNIADMSLQEIAYVISNTLFGDMLNSATIKKIVDDSLNFNIPVKQLTANKYVLELFHGPTLSFKDIGARFMSRLLQAIHTGNTPTRDIIVATAGDSGGAIAHAFSRRANVTVNILFPRGELTKSQVAQFATISNVRAIEVNGTLDECQQLVKEALTRDAASGAPHLTPGNSINLAQELTAIICFFHAYAQVIRQHRVVPKVVIAIPCGNLGSLCAALMARQMGLPVERFVATNNVNNTFVKYLKTGEFHPKQASATIARTMDVGNPVNLARVIDLYSGNLSSLRHIVEGYTYTDDEIVQTMLQTKHDYGYIISPRGATALRALNQSLQPGEVGIALSGSHPAKVREIITQATGVSIDAHPDLEALTNSPMKIAKIPATYGALHRILQQPLNH